MTSRIGTMVPNVVIAASAMIWIVFGAVDIGHGGQLLAPQVHGYVLLTMLGIMLSAVAMRLMAEAKLGQRATQRETVERLDAVDHRLEAIEARMSDGYAFGYADGLARRPAADLRLMPLPNGSK